MHVTVSLGDLLLVASFVFYGGMTYWRVRGHGEAIRELKADVKEHGLQLQKHETILEGLQ